MDPNDTPDNQEMQRSARGPQAREEDEDAMDTDEVAEEVGPVSAFCPAFEFCRIEGPLTTTTVDYVARYMIGRIAIVSPLPFRRFQRSGWITAQFDAKKSVLIASGGRELYYQRRYFRDLPRGQAFPSEDKLPEWKELGRKLSEEVKQDPRFKDVGGVIGPYCLCMFIDRHRLDEGRARTPNQAFDDLYQFVQNKKPELAAAAGVPAEKLVFDQYPRMQVVSVGPAPSWEDILKTTLEVTKSSLEDLPPQLRNNFNLVPIAPSQIGASAARGSDH
jgi:hypothetical protein